MIAILGKACFDPSVVEAGNEAFGLYVRAASWSNDCDNRSGFIPAAVAKVLGAYRLFLALEAVNLVERWPHGWQLLRLGDLVTIRSSKSKKRDAQ